MVKLTLLDDGPISMIHTTTLAGTKAISLDKVNERKMCIFYEYILWMACMIFLLFRKEEQQRMGFVWGADISRYCVPPVIKLADDYTA